jgi:ABC-type antimicrobial peptide transport system permease subunit
LTMLGVGIGLAGSFVVARFLASLLFGVGTYDPPTFLGVAVLLVAVALSASYIPARRAMQVDPIVALRYE